MNKKWVYSFLGVLIFLGLVVYFVSALTYNAHSNVRFQRDNVDYTNWTKYGDPVVINFTINLSEDTSSGANITNITITGPEGYFNFTFGNSINHSLGDTAGKNLTCNPPTASHYKLLCWNLTNAWTQLKGNATFYIWMNVTANWSGIERNNSYEATGNKDINMELSTVLDWTVTVTTRGLSAVNYTTTLTFNKLGIDGLAPRVTEINLSYTDTAGNIKWLKDELGEFNQTKYIYNNSVITIWAVVTDSNLKNYFNKNVSIYWNNVTKTLLDLNVSASNTGSSRNMSQQSNNGKRYTFNFTLNGTGSKWFADGMNFSFHIIAGDNFSQFRLQNNSLAGGYNFTFDGRAPDNPEITMPSQKAYYARTSITLKCNGGPDYGSGEDKTEITITRPDGTTTTKTVDTSGNAEFKDENIKDAGSYTVSCQTTDNVGLYSTDTTTDEFTVVYRSYGEPAEGAPAAEVTKFDLDFTQVTEKPFEKTEGASIKFTLDGVTEHTMTWSIVSADTITLTIESDPITITLKVGETKEVDINGDGANDMAVTLESIEGSKARVTTKRLAGAEKAAEEVITPPPITPPTEEVKTSWIWITVIIVVIILAVAGYFLMKKK